MKKNGIKQIAELANCSCATVSRVLNNRPGISDDVRQKIMALANEVDYTNSKKRRIIALIVYLDKDGFDLYSMRLLRLMVLGLQRAGFHVEVLFNEDIGILGEHYISGIVSINVVGNTANEWGVKFKLPMICVNDYDNLLEDIHIVHSDDRQAIEGAVNYLVECGHKAIWLMTPKYRDNYSNNKRVSAFEEYIEKLGLKENCGVLFCRSRFFFSIPTDDYVKQLPKECTALISTIEPIAVKLYASLQKFRPDITFVTWGMPWQKELNTLKIPYMQQDFSALVDKTIELLIDRLDGKAISNCAVPYIFKKSGRKIK